MTRQMICEGPCNPKLPALDAVVALERQEAARMLRLNLKPYLKGGRMTKPMLTSEFLDDLTKLKHTGHESQGPLWVCSACGTGRL